MSNKAAFTFLVLPIVLVAIAVYVFILYSLPLMVSLLVLGLVIVFGTINFGKKSKAKSCWNMSLFVSGIAGAAYMIWRVGF